MSKDYKPFSEREGHRQPKLKLESMSKALRTGLWNEFYYAFPDHPVEPGYGMSPSLRHPMCMAIWLEHLKGAVDEYPGCSPSPNFVKDVFLSAEWFEVFDLIEFCLQRLKPERDNLSRVARDRRTLPPQALFEDRCNQVLEKENLAYTIVEGLVTPITSKQEIEEIETALRVPYGPAKEHIRKALVLFSNRQNPDYKNSINESIQAVESIAKEVTGDSNATLGKLTKRLQKRLNLHSVFVEGLNKLYGFTSDVTRHGNASRKSDKHPKPDQATARFMLVLCSAFVNYIISQNPKQQKR